MKPRSMDLSDFDDEHTGRPAGAAPHAPKPGGIAARAMAQPPAADAPYLASLNPEQLRAVETIDGPVLVLAGAGTGKTRVLTTRLAHILATGRAFPGQILAVTFTNKAAREMKERIGMLIGGIVEGMNWLGTFHSIGVKILRRHAELVGLRSDFSILDTDDQLRLLKQVIALAEIDEKRWPARHLASLIDSWKNRGLSPERVPTGESHAYANGRGAELYAAYQARMKLLNACDFGDLIIEPLRLFLEHPDVAAEYQRKFKYMLVDEYQDTNVAQYLWLKLLAQGHRNICCVGDDDQSIYGWRGAEVDNILRFEKDFPGAQVIRLERNYRSTPHILSAASGLIANNEGRLGKTLHTDVTTGEKVIVRGHWDAEEEARTIGETIEQAKARGENLSDMAVLVRASFQMREIEDRFINLGIPYKVIGGPRFYERQEIRDALAYLKVTAQPDNDLAFERIVNLPKRGIGDSSIKKVHAFARAEGLSLFRAAEAIVATDELPVKARTALRQLCESFRRWRSLLDGMPHTDVAEMVLDESGYTEMWQNDRTPEAPGRLENLKELIRSMAEFETLGGFLEHIALVMDSDNAGTEDRVSIMTLHAAKGLEFDTVFLPGWEEGLFPHQRAMDESGQAGLEEERRLAYVGITRARKRCIISFAQNRRIHALWQSAMPSRFIDELPPDDVEVIQSSSGYASSYTRGWAYGESRFDRANPYETDYSTPGWKRARQAYQSGTSVRSMPHFIEGEIIARDDSDSTTYRTGDRVRHEKFGAGTVKGVDGNKLTIEFDAAGEKRVLASFVSAGD
jgi:DNA helicase-2/ATP-dependent DNA helicase PcrA